MTDGARILKTKFWRPESEPDVPKSGLNLGFLPFGLLVFLENAYSDSLQQCLTSSRGKIYKKKNFRAQVWAKRAKIGSETRFFSIFSSFVH